MKAIETAAFVGIGAVGSIYADCALRAGASVFAIVPETESYQERPVYLNGERLSIPLRTPESAAEPVDLAVLCVKWRDLPQAIQHLTPFMGPHTQIISLMNGIRSEPVLAERFGWHRVLLAMCSGVDSCRIGRVVTMRHRGVICFGERRNDTLSERVETVYDFLRRAHIPCEVSLDMENRLWWKLMVNVGMNQVSAVTGLHYGDFRRSAEAMAWMCAAQREVIAVAQRQGVDLSEADIALWERQLMGLSEDGCSSMLQDVLNHRPTEVDVYAGEICEHGRRLGIPTPVNADLMRRIKEIEAS